MFRGAQVPVTAGNPAPADKLKPAWGSGCIGAFKPAPAAVAWYNWRMEQNVHAANPSGLQDPKGLRAIIHRTNWLAFIGYAVLAVLFYAPVLLDQQTLLAGDFNQHFLPFSQFWRSELLAGRLPLWNPYTYAGHPFLADVQAAVFYPLSNLVLFLTLPWQSLAARLYWLEVEVVLHTALAGFFTYLLVRDLIKHSGPAFLAGSVFAFSGYLTGYPPLQLAILRAVIWLPLILWLLRRGITRPDQSRWWVGAALAYASAFLAGHTQSFLYISYVVTAWLVLLVVWPGLAGGSERRRRRLVGRSLLFYGLTIGLCAAQLLPSLEFSSLSVRAGVDYAYVSGGFPVGDTWQVLVPAVLTFFSPLYVGVAALGLALLAVGSAVTRRWTRTAPVAPAGVMMFFAGMVVLALLVSYGQNGFLYPLFYRWLPGWNLFRGQERAAYLVTFGLSVLAGLGAAQLPGLTPRVRRYYVAGFAILLALGLAGFVMTHPLAADAGAVVTAVVFSAGVTVALLLILWPGGWSRRRTGLLVGLCIVDLLVVNWGTITISGSTAAAVELPPAAMAVQAAVAEQGGAAQGLPGRVHNEYRVFENYGMPAHVEDVWGASPLRLARYAALFDNFPMDRMWRLTGVQHLLTWTDTPSQPAVQLAEFPQGSETTYLHRLTQTPQRAWVASQWLRVDDKDAKTRLADPTFDVDNLALLPLPEAQDGGPSDSEMTVQATAPGTNAIQLARLAPNRLHIDVKSENGGLLVVSENWMPGWRATLTTSDASEARSVPVWRADLTLLGLAVPAGSSRIDLVYAPDSVHLGLVISALALVLVGVWAIYRLRRPATTR